MERLDDGSPRYARRDVQAGDSLWICHLDRKKKIWVCHYGKKPSDIPFGDGMSARVSPQSVTLRGVGWEDDAKLIAFLKRVSEAIKKSGKNF